MHLEPYALTAARQADAKTTPAITSAATKPSLALKRKVLV
jgi:hypothetical protein